MSVLKICGNRRRQDIQYLNEFQPDFAGFILSGGFGRSIVTGTFYELKSYLDACGIGYVIDPHIVRGLDYYTRTVFEFIAEGIGSQSTVCGGGRYDGLMEELGGPKMAGIGFGMGITRLILAMKQNGVTVPTLAVPELYIAAMGKEAAVRAAGIVKQLRDRGVNADSDIMGRSLKAQMKYADKIAARFVLILGDSEIESGRAVIKEMASSEQTEVALDEIGAFLDGKRA